MTTNQFAGLYSDVLVDTVTGLPLRLTAYTVYNSDGVTLSTIYSSRVKAAKANPATTDAQGNATFYADPGIYVIKVAGSTVITVFVTVDAAETPPGITTTAGDLIIAGASGVPKRFAVPATAGQTNVADPSAGTDQKWASGNPVAIADKAVLPTGAIAATMRRESVRDNMAALTSAQLFLVAIELAKGQLVSSATFFSGTTALSAGVNQWFALYDSARALLAVTNDDGATAWAANSAKTLNFAVAYTVTASGLYYLGIMIKATVPSLLGAAMVHANVPTAAPILCGNSTAALTNPASAPNPAGAITPTVNKPWAWVS